MKKVLVTGGGGFLGTHVCRLLKNNGYEVFSFSRSHYQHLDDLGVKTIQGNLKEFDSVNAALKGMDIVFHVASLAGVWGEYETYFDTNVIGAQNIIEGCLKNEIQYLIYTSTPSVAYQDGGVEGVNEAIGYTKNFKSPYAETKAVAEQMVREIASDKLKTVSLRPHLIWGPGDHHFKPRIVERAQKGKMKLIDGGHCLVDHIHVHNAAQAHLDALNALMSNPKQVNGKAYFLSQGEPISVKDFINKIFLEPEKIKPVTKSISFKIAYAVGAILEFVYGALRIKSEPLMTRFMAEQLATPHWFDISAAKKDLGYLPRDYR